MTPCKACREYPMGQCAACGAALCLDCLYEDHQYRFYDAIDRPDHAAAFEPHCDRRLVVTSQDEDSDDALPPTP